MSCLLAICLQLGLGMAHANAQDCGIWYTCSRGSEYVLHQNAGTYSAGVAGRAWRAGVQSLGHTQTDALVAEPGMRSVYFHTTGAARGLYAEALFPAGLLTFEAGLWAYRSTVLSDIGAHHFSSGAAGLGPMFGVSYAAEHLSIGASIRGAENRSCDWNGNHQPSPTKGFATTLELRVTL